MLVRYQNLTQTDSYRLLDDLIKFNQESQILDLLPNDISFDEDAPERKKSLKNFIPSFTWNKNIVHSETDAKVEKVSKLIRKKINSWTESLDTILWEVMYNPPQIEYLKNMVKTIIDNCTIALIRKQLKALHSDSEKIEKALSKLELVITRINSVNTLQNPIKTIAPLISPFPCLFPRNTFNYPIQPLNIPNSEPPHVINDSVEIESVDSSTASQDFSQKKCQTESILKAQQILVLTAKNSKDWIENIATALKSINDIEAIKHVGKNIQAYECMNLIQRIVNDHEHNWKLSYLMGSMSLPVFKYVIAGLDINTLSFINEILIKCDTNCTKWLKEQFERMKDGFISECNHMKIDIDLLCSRFRDDDEGHKITLAEINDINRFANEVNIQRGIFPKLQTLLKDILKHPESKHVLFEGLVKEYQTFTIRLSEKRSYENRPAGCVWGIIFRNVFERCDLDDEDDVIDIFGDWAITDPDDYRNTGLLGDISNEEFQGLKSNVSDVYKRAKENLDFLNIHQIKDLKRLDIYNRHMLFAFMMREDIKAKLKPGLSPNLLPMHHLNARD
ncbi:MAG: hypothetical protein VX777_05815 [Chlamydiota bacterium]|nr:hypothetical protein [Chlamydiota bacterium]